MAKLFPRKQRNTFSRVPRPIMLIVAEGNNVTERQYFHHFQHQYIGYNIKIDTKGFETDPEGMLDTLTKYWKENELSLEKGDRGYVILDLDCNDKKAQLIKKLEAGTNLASFVVSNPCFEVWFLLHFRYSTHAYASGEEVINDLRKYIADYRKNSDVFDVISEATDTALQNAKKLEQHFGGIGYKWPSNKCNPRTDIPIVIEEIRRMRGNCQ